MANKDKKNNNFKQALDEIMQGKLTTEKEEVKGEKEVMADVTKNIRAIADTKHPETEETVIGAGVVIEGNVRTTGKLVIRGAVTGNVVSTADLEITGTVGGRVQGANILLNDCELKDTVTATGEVKVSTKSIVNGDIKAGAIINEGSINGNINANSVTLMGTSKTVGDISCSSIRITEGAFLKGKLETV